jgi:V8-like Glu-specific endopeptidase
MFNNRNVSDHMTRLYLSLSQCGFSDGEPKVCCRNPVEAYTPNTASRIDGETTAPRFDALPKPGECGMYAENRMLNGNETRLDEHLWMALLEYEKRKQIESPQGIPFKGNVLVAGNQKGFHCGGVLIHKRFVLTGEMKEILETQKTFVDAFQRLTALLAEIFPRPGRDRRAFDSESEI